MTNKKPVNELLYLPVPVLLLTALSLLQTINVSAADLYYYIAVLTALVIGMVHVLVINKSTVPVPPGRISPDIRLSLLILFFSVLAIAIIYYYAGLNFQFVTFIISFIIPGICRQAFLYFFKLSGP